MRLQNFLELFADFSKIFFEIFTNLTRNVQNLLKIFQKSLISFVHIFRKLYAKFAKNFLNISSNDPKISWSIFLFFKIFLRNFDFFYAPVFSRQICLSPPAYQILFFNYLQCANAGARNRVIDKRSTA